MPAYYNEIDPYAAQWLRNLIDAGHIAPGVVDERSIEDVHPRDLDGFEQCHFFAGIGVWSHALRRAGWADDRPVWTGSCPCQPFSTAGKGVGFDDERHLWPAWHHLITQHKPAVVFGEQVASALDWLDLVQSDLENLDYAFGVVPIQAACAGSFQLRDRLFFVAGSARIGRGEECSDPRWLPARNSKEGVTAGPLPSRACLSEPGLDGKRRAIEPGLEPLVAGPIARVGRLRAYGNAINAEAAVAFIEAFGTDRLWLQPHRSV